MLRRSLVSTSKTFSHIRWTHSMAYNESLLQLKKDLKESMIAKDTIKKNTIKGILSEVKNFEIDSKEKHNLNEFSLYDTFSKMIAQRQDSIANYESNNRNDLMEKELQEINIIKTYQNLLPVSSKEEIDKKVLETLQLLKDSDPSMKMKQVFGKFDWKTLPNEWKTSQAVIKSSIVAQYKKIFPN